jgi:hypothetical protein
MIRRNCLFFFIIGLLLSFFSCQSPPPCEDANGVQVNLGFFYNSGTALSDTLIDSLVVYALTDKSTLYFDGTKTKDSTIALPLSMTSDTSVYIFNFGTEGSDTLEFCYIRHPKLVSYECGFVVFDTLTGVNVTHNHIDSVWIRKDLVEYGDEENVKIYF